MLKWCTNIRWTCKWYWNYAPISTHANDIERKHQIQIQIHTQMILKWYWNDVPIIKHTCKWYWNEVPIINRTFDWYWNDTPNKIQTNTKFSNEQIRIRNLYQILNRVHYSIPNYLKEQIVCTIWTNSGTKPKRHMIILIDRRKLIDMYVSWWWEPKYETLLLSSHSWKQSELPILILTHTDISNIYLYFTYNYCQHLSNSKWWIKGWKMMKK